MDSLSGMLLAASPRLQDPNFARAVILIVQHGEEGAFGVVLNKPGKHRVAEVWHQVGGDACALDQPIHIGGPVEGPLLAVHGDSEASEREVLPGVHFASQKDALERLVEHPVARVILIAGYSGWGEGQLENELREGSWLVAPASVDRVFFEGEDHWKDLVAQIGGEVIHARGDIRHVPAAPWHN
jgi:putative transcriptional regulator